MDKPMIEALAERVARLERENRRLKWGGLVALGGLVLVVIVGGAKLVDDKDIVAAKRFILFDEKDKARAMMSVDPEHGPGISFFHTDESRRIDIRVNPDGSLLVSLYGEEGKGVFPMASLHVLSGIPGLVLTRSKDGPLVKPGVSLMDFSKGPSVQLTDADGKIRARLTLGSNGTPGFVLSDAEGKPLFQAPRP